MSAPSAAPRRSEPPFANSFPALALKFLLRRRRERALDRAWVADASPWAAENRRRLAALAGRHRGQPGVVIGNGPSLNRMDLNRLRQVVTVACNSFYLKHAELDFVPTYYTVEDVLVAEDNRDELSALQGTAKIVPYDLRHLIRDDGATAYLNFQRSYMLSSSRHFPRFSLDLARRAYWGGTVAFLGIQIAHFLGCAPIYLIGIDLSYSIPASARKSGVVLTSTADDPNHFHPAYFGAGKRWHLPEVERMQRSFAQAWRALDGVGVRLLNATDGGNLKEVPRAAYDEIFAAPAGRD